MVRLVREAMALASCGGVVWVVWQMALVAHAA